MSEEPRFPAPDTPVTKGTRLAPATNHEGGPGTYEQDGFLVADRDGMFRTKDTVVRVVPPPPRRPRRGQRIGDDGLPVNAANTHTPGKGIHRHGLGKHGTLRGKKKKGFGDQGTWD